MGLLAIRVSSLETCSSPSPIFELGFCWWCVLFLTLRAPGPILKADCAGFLWLLGHAKVASIERLGPVSA